VGVGRWRRETENERKGKARATGQSRRPDEEKRRGERLLSGPRCQRESSLVRVEEVTIPGSLLLALLTNK
jgi:hypothetical protein